ncbi:MAG TPA: ferritin-like domain-containing protein [Myxococcales bacterium]|nr:ferritin-like domain-containing protein [Myxococcales bacterium]
MSTTGANHPPEAAFLSDVSELRRRAHEKLEQGSVTDSYQGSIETAIELLNGVLATEIVCTLRYRFHAITAKGIASEAVKQEFEAHAAEEEEHAGWVAERINQLGGKPNLNPDGLASRASSQYAEGLNLIDMIKEDLVAERIAVMHYQELVRYFANHDPTTRRLLEKILEKEEEHANDMHDLLVSHEGRPMLKS